MATELFSSRSVFVMAAVFPFLGVLACWGVYYGMGHHYGNKIRTISETVMPFPENRIFPSIMNMECIFLGMAFLVREKYIRSQIKCGFVYRFLVFTLAPSILIGLSVLADLTLKDHLVAHLAGASVFFMGMIIYELISDFKLAKTGRKIGVSRIVPYIGTILFFVYMYIFQNYKHDPRMYSIGSLCQYVMAFFIFLKVFLWGWDIPKFPIVLSVLSAKKK